MGLVVKFVCLFEVVVDFVVDLSDITFNVDLLGRDSNSHCARDSKLVHLVCIILRIILF